MYFKQQQTDASDEIAKLNNTTTNRLYIDLGNNNEFEIAKELPKTTSGLYNITTYVSDIMYIDGNTNNQRKIIIISEVDFVNNEEDFANGLYTDHIYCLTKNNNNVNLYYLGNIKYATHDATIDSSVRNNYFFPKENDKNFNETFVYYENNLFGLNEISAVKEGIMSGDIIEFGTQKEIGVESNNSLFKYVTQNTRIDYILSTNGTLSQHTYQDIVTTNVTFKVNILNTTDSKVDLNQIELIATTSSTEELDTTGTEQEYNNKSVIIGGENFVISSTGPMSFYINDTEYVFSYSGDKLQEFTVDGKRYDSEGNPIGYENVNDSIWYRKNQKDGKTEYAFEDPNTNTDVEIFKIKGLFDFALSNDGTILATNQKSDTSGITSFVIDPNNAYQITNIVYKQTLGKNTYEVTEDYAKGTLIVKNGESQLECSYSDLYNIKVVPSTITNESESGFTTYLNLNKVTQYKYLEIKKIEDSTIIDELTLDVKSLDVFRTSSSNIDSSVILYFINNEHIEMYVGQGQNIAKKDLTDSYDFSEKTIESFTRSDKNSKVDYVTITFSDSTNVKYDLENGRIYLGDGNESEEFVTLSYDSTFKIYYTKYKYLTFTKFDLTSSQYTDFEVSYDKGSTASITTMYPFTSDEYIFDYIIEVDVQGQKQYYTLIKGYQVSKIENTDIVQVETKNYTTYGLSWSGQIITICGTYNGGKTIKGMFVVTKSLTATDGTQKYENLNIVNKLTSGDQTYTTTITQVVRTVSISEDQLITIEDVLTTIDDNKNEKTITYTYYISKYESPLFIPDEDLTKVEEEVEMYGNDNSEAPVWSKYVTINGYNILDVISSTSTEI